MLVSSNESQIQKILDKDELDCLGKVSDRALWTRSVPLDLHSHTRFPGSIAPTQPFRGKRSPTMRTWVPCASFNPTRANARLSLSRPDEHDPNPNYNDK